jgi:hypothetical protein
VLSTNVDAVDRSTSAGTVPFELIKGHVYVHGFVNDRGPYLLVLDTGASGMGRADVRLVSELGLRKVGEEQNSDGIRTVAVDVVGAASLRLGSVLKRNVRLLARDYNVNKPSDRPVVMGIIGADFFADKLITIDYPARVIRFSDGRLRRGQAGVFSYSGKFRVPVCIRDLCVPGMIDSGSSMSVVLPKSMFAQVRASKPVLVGQGRRTNSVSKVYEMTLVDPLSIGSITATNLKVQYADPSDDEINVGSGFLKDYVLVIDQRHHLLKIGKPKR